jgi:hypothetical protein
LSKESISHEVVQSLRERSAGKDVWRVQDKDEKSYCIQFESWEQIEAFEWWNKHKDREFHANHELVRLRIYSHEDQLMQQAADMLEFFFNQMQMCSPKMDGGHLWRLQNAWPMTHCIGPTEEEAVRAAMAEVARANSEKV